MARMPGAVWQGEHGSLAMVRYDIVCVHTIVGYAPAHAAHFSTKADGTILQSRDTKYQSGANLDGNERVIAIENEDHGPAFPAWSGSNVPALTAAQVSANAAILRWAHETHGVPLQLCPNSRPESRGLAYHRQGIDGNFTTYPGRVSGGELWSEHFGKVCPGDRRIEQRPEILAQAQEDDMALTDDDIRKIRVDAVREELNYQAKLVQGISSWEVYLESLINAARGAATPSEVTSAVQGLIDDIAAAVVEALPEGSVDVAIVEAAVARVFAGTMGHMSFTADDGG